MAKKRVFMGSASIRTGGKTLKVELAPAEHHGGQEGAYRLRVNRSWLDGPEGQRRFMGQKELGSFIASALTDVPQLLMDMPVLPRSTRVTVRYQYRSNPTQAGLYTSTPPVRCYDGTICVGVMTPDAGWLWVPVRDVYVQGRGWLE